MSVNKNANQANTSRRSFLLGSRLVSLLTAAGTGTFVLRPNWAHADGHIKMGIATDI